METQTTSVKKPTDQVLAEALVAIDNLALQSERAPAVKLAVKALLVVRGALHPKLFSKGDFNPYPAINKYVRASNQETLAGIVDDALRNISPEFITLQALGDAAAALYANGDVEAQAIAILKEETIPVVLLMKSLYQKARGGVDEADQTQEVNQTQMENKS
jgi:stage V sporulation protein SpoVS